MKVIEGHYERKYWEIIERSKVPEHCEILPSV